MGEAEILKLALNGASFSLFAVLFVWLLAWVLKRDLAIQEKNIAREEKYESIIKTNQEVIKAQSETIKSLSEDVTDIKQDIKYIFRNGVK